jgi:hypothetical protein
MVIAYLAAALANAADIEPGGAPTPRTTKSPQVSAAAATGSTPPSEETYHVPLSLAYATPLSLQVATWFVPALDAPLYSGASLVTMLAAPFIVHSAYDNGEGAWMAGVGILGSLLGGAVVGTVVLAASGLDVCRDCDDAIGELGSQIVIGGSIGAGTGYLVWGVIDTVLHARVPRRARPGADRALETLAILPSVGFVGIDAGTSRATSAGFALRLAGTF